MICHPHKSQFLFSLSFMEVAYRYCPGDLISILFRYQHIHVTAMGCAAVNGDNAGIVVRREAGVIAKFTAVSVFTVIGSFGSRCRLNSPEGVLKTVVKN